MTFSADEPPDTRSRIISLLRRGHCTVKELAGTLQMTGNAIRVQLSKLERDGLVRPSGKRPGVRKPMTIYGLTPEAERLFPRPYGVILGHLLDVFKDRATPTELHEIVRAAGRRIALDCRPTGEAGRPTNLVRRALALLREFGGVCEPQDRDGKTVLSCSDCPLATVANGRPEVCTLMETVLSEALGVRIRQRCRPEPTPQCQFEIDTADASSD